MQDMTIYVSGTVLLMAAAYMYGHFRRPSMGDGFGEMADRCKRCMQEMADHQAVLLRNYEGLVELSSSVFIYRQAIDRSGYGSPEADRAWDILGESQGRAKSFIELTQEFYDSGSEACKPKAGGDRV